MEKYQKIVLSLLCLILASCTGPLQRLDSESNQMIHQFQGASLGSEAVSDPARVPPRPLSPEVSDRAYRTHLPSVNPSSKILPAQEAAESKELPALKMNLERCLAYAIEHSREYRNEKDDLYLASLALLAERHLWGPRFFNTVSAQLVGTPETGDTDHAMELINDLTVTHKLPYGGEVSATALVSFVDAMRADSPDPGDSAAASVIVSLEKPLLRGAGQSAREPLIQAYRNLIYEVREFERFRREFLVDVAEEYFGLLQAQGDIGNRELQVKNLKRLYEQEQEKLRLGREGVEKFDVQQAESQAAFAENNLNNGRLRLESLLDSFKIRLGMPIDQPLEVLPTTESIEQVLPNIREASTAALAYRLDLQTSKDRVDDARRLAAVARNNMLPDLDLNASIFLPTDPNRRFDRYRLDAGSGTYNVGLSLGLPLDRRQEQIGYRSSLIELQRSQRSYSLHRDRVLQAVRTAIRDISQATVTKQLQSRNLDIAKARLELVTIRREAVQADKKRRVIPRDSIEAEEDLLEARDRYNIAIRNLRVSWLRYLLATGQLRVDESGKWIRPGLWVEPQPKPDAP